MTYIAAATSRLADAIFGRGQGRARPSEQQEDEDSLVVKNTFYHCPTGVVKDMRRTSSEPAGHASLRTDSTSSDADLVAELPAKDSLNNGQGMLGRMRQNAHSLRTASIDEAPEEEEAAEQEEEDQILKENPNSPGRYIGNQYSSPGGPSRPDSPSSPAMSAGASIGPQLGSRGGRIATAKAVQRPPPGIKAVPVGGGGGTGNIMSPTGSMMAPTVSTSFQQSRQHRDDGGPPLKSTSIADLQALLQSADASESFRYPPGTQVLQWTHSEIANHTGQPTFCAVVAYLRDGVGHHVAGACGRSKRQARQSAADIALALARGQMVNPPDDPRISVYVDTGALLLADGTGACYPATAADVGEFTMACMDGFQGRACLDPSGSNSWAKPTWSFEAVGPGLWQAFVEVQFLGVLHNFSGPHSTTQEHAIAETARRVLWYLGHAAYRGFYKPDSMALLADNCKVPLAPAFWPKGQPPGLTTTS